MMGVRPENLWINDPSTQANRRGEPAVNLCAPSRRQMCRLPVGKLLLNTICTEPYLGSCACRHINDGSDHSPIPKISASGCRTGVFHNDRLKMTEHGGAILIFGARVRVPIEAKGAELRYLPPNSPDLNPIEQMFAKFKALLRKIAARSVEALWTAIGQLVSQFLPHECANYVRNSAYVRSA